jgi:phage-related protein
MGHMLIPGGLVDIGTKTKRLRIRTLLATLLGAALLCSISAIANGQSEPAQRNVPGRDDDATHRQLAEMDQFLDSHPEVSEQLRRDPSLINKGEFVNQHPALQEFLQQHPGVRDQFSQNPNAFMHQEQRFDQRDNDRDTTRRELAGMDQFLDAHPEISEQLRRDPSLIKKGEFVNQHPALQEFLQQHPGVREQFSQNPNAFMHQEQRFDQRENDQDFDRRDRDRDNDHNATHRELAGMDQFLDAHPEISEQLRRDPSLIKKDAFVNQHPALQEFLQQHPGVRDQFSQNPNAFMHQEQRFDQRENDRYRDSDNRVAQGDRYGHQELNSFGEFLGGHSSVAQQLAKDPSLANNKEYVANHPELGEYLKAHPAMSQQLAQNPQGVMSSNWVQQGTSAAPKVSSPKPKPNQ